MVFVLAQSDPSVADTWDDYKYFQGNNEMDGMTGARGPRKGKMPHMSNMDFGPLNTGGG